MQSMNQEYIRDCLTYPRGFPIIYNSKYENRILQITSLFNHRKNWKSVENRVRTTQSMNHEYIRDCLTYPRGFLMIHISKYENRNLQITILRHLFKSSKFLKIGWITSENGPIEIWIIPLHVFTKTLLYSWRTSCLTHNGEAWTNPQISI